ncbi:MAG: RhuM family protein [bacterium]
MEINQNSQIVIYKSPSGETKIDVRFDGDTVWLTQNSIANLFQTTKNNISLHVKNIFAEGELSRNATVKNCLTVQKEGGRDVSRDIEYYNLDLIISIGYRVKSNIATAFRQWATARLSEYVVKGFVIDFLFVSDFDREVKSF